MAEEEIGSGILSSMGLPGPSPPAQASSAALPTSLALFRQQAG